MGWGEWLSWSRCYHTLPESLPVIGTHACARDKALLMGSIMTLFGGMAQCIADVVTSGAKNLVSLGWAKEPQPRLAGDNSALPKLGMGHGGHVVRELHLDHAVADFAKRHASKLGGAFHPYPHSLWCTCTLSPNPPPWPGHSFRACLPVVMYLTYPLTYSLHPPPWPGITLVPFSAQLRHFCVPGT